MKDPTFLFIVRKLYEDGQKEDGTPFRTPKNSIEDAMQEAEERKKTKGYMSMSLVRQNDDVWVFEFYNPVVVVEEK